MLFDLYPLFKNVAFRFDPESVHDATLWMAEHFPNLTKLVSPPPPIDGNRYSVRIGHSVWGFPIGLPAGMDKNCQAPNFFSNLGFGAIEIGTVTPLPQSGNPRPRLFRYPDKKSIRNCMGFNNDGAELVLSRVMQQKHRMKVPLGVNLGKNKLTTQEMAYSDYQKLYEAFASVADYLVINISSPNTPGLRDLQQVKEICYILDSLDHQRKRQPVDLYLKIAPDLSLDDVTSLTELAKEKCLTGIIATNTTIMPELGSGGVSGELLKERAQLVRNHVLQMTREVAEFEVIGVGGISTFDDLWDFWSRGGKAAQLFTALIYQGPFVLERMRREIDLVLSKNSVATLDMLLSNVEHTVR